MNRPYVTRYTKLISAEEIKPNHEINRSSLNMGTYDFSNDGPATEQYNRKFFTALRFNVDAILYPVRFLNVYILSYKGKSKIYDRNKDLYNELIKKKLMNPSIELYEIFQSYGFLDFQRISDLIMLIPPEGVQTHLVNISILDCYVKETDVFYQNPYLDYDAVSSLSIVPCLFEDKYAVEILIRTSCLSQQINDKLKGDKFKKTREAFSMSCEVIQELVEKLPLDLRF